MYPDILRLTLYYATQDAAFIQNVEELRAALAKHLPPESWTLEVVDVVEMPEIALKNDVFATPTLVRVFPEPLLKLLGEVVHADKVLAVVTKVNHETTTIIL